MKKLFSFVLVFVMLVSLVGCRQKYKPVKSTKEEAKVIYTINLDGEKYEIKYELYRAFFLNYKTQVDGGDESVWSGADKEDYILEINKIIIDNATEIFAAFHLAKTIGINPYSKDIDKQIEEYIRISVEGDGNVVGFGGSYDDYLTSLTEMNLNYAVQEMLIRYSITLEKINEYYIGTEDEVLGLIPGDYQASKEEIRSYYFSDDSARILYAYMQDGTATDALARMQSLKSSLSCITNPKEAALLIINNTSVTASDLISDKEVSGIVVGKNTINDNFYKEYSDVIFSLEVGQTSDIIEINDGAKSYYVVYKLEKSDAHFEKFYEDIKLSYLDSLICTRLVNVANSLAQVVKVNDNYKKIVHSEISMN